MMLYFKDPVHGEGQSIEDWLDSIIRDYDMTECDQDKLTSMYWHLREVTTQFQIAQVYIAKLENNTKEH